MPYHFFIAFRYLKSKKRRKGISLNTAISAGGVAVGVMALLVVLSVMSGFHEDLQRKILGVNAHIVALSYRGAIIDYKEVLDNIRGEKDVVSASPFVLGQVMSSSGKMAHGVFLRGIDPSLEANTTEIGKYIKDGRLDDLKSKDGIPGIAIGKELANSLGVFRNDIINIISAVGEIGPMGMLPKVRQFRVAAIFEVGMFEYDSNLVLTELSHAQNFFGMGNSITGIEIKVKDVYKAKEVREQLQKKLAFPYYGRDWMQMHKNLFSALKLEKLAMFVILVLIILVASFNIIGTLMMNVVEKSREIAILKAMGATNKGIMTIFMLQGIFIGLAGTLLGIAGGYILGYMFNNVIRLPADVYYLSRLPIKMKLLDFIAVSLSALTISFLATIYPAWQAAKLNPIEPLRYE
ncbi:MAG: lipoprotein-releasing system transmembrane subunit LolC [Nitrospirae bacterium CG_4_10_14_3_um_filter_44_29]|nr:lipoprotein-releasing ABC transporter permease subunit [Nitrospirota bacterium]OIO30329.1 MAG: ABC transporter permease [Nitrospirae bacterium CG1_02_44_142]PIP69764.1 MAG: lipoprotein-releasing system transmembrane subunit LolC [Nitrospirae bacterium CG22_combo_CG10-13_8_21_14_all_44_11]PIV41437.1 MAG: lipoprotein-releasing system transmembrane subunit LolC [Nitrospirae bacterium CG02_land_8_20_14_3_00_44_33]PIV65839.1 MAG: lipoprotein-releasing system transmembrane subunit LolC [Nitrospira